jgi:hypothetical protein
VVVFEEGDKSIEIGARTQIQYLLLDPEDGPSRDRLFFRRLRPYIQGTVTENWTSRIEFDFGEALDSKEVAVKDAYVRYTGWKHGRITVGNQKPGFSRQFLTSSSYQQLVERGFAGDHNFGTPDRSMVVMYEGHAADRNVTYSAAAGAAHHDPAAGAMDFDSPVVNQADWNEGLLFAGRVDVHPLGFVKFDRGDFGRTDPRYNLSAAFFRWRNDDDNNTYTDPLTGLTTAEGIAENRADLDGASGLELSGGFRGRGWSADAEVQRITGDTVDPTFDGGIYVNGSTDLDKLSINAGYMVVDERLEIVGAWDSIDADGYATEWTRASVGVNLFADRHNAKLQLTYQVGENVSGVRGSDLDSFQAQAQFAF